MLNSGNDIVPCYASPKIIRRNYNKSVFKSRTTVVATFVCKSAAIQCGNRVGFVKVKQVDEEMLENACYYLILNNIFFFWNF